MFTVHDYGFELIDHPPYSLDLAPSDYFLFPNLKKINWYQTNDIISATEDIFESQELNIYTMGM